MSNTSVKGNLFTAFTIALQSLSILEVFSYGVGILSGIVYILVKLGENKKHKAETALADRQLKDLDK